ncbi:[FeFe] hydrogenase H-cluster radical SAM maturase HydE [Chitinispirillales bacterium ANBcel5]|uniref:[FeFe] hydrogenase H-cluster radical SAM maturase HydE n=1 Tax=Cellulosispirillum alkaliphilum TaxID=3039283 RepID=UPI002A52CDDA|nr:[FeFe] hydrogenase H-cluster radical SAM maturase HydE [Chitinispirillales bacterium ANBcel5]
MSIDEIIQKENFSKEDIIKILSVRKSSELDKIKKAAQKKLFENCGAKVYYRGLIEFSNTCIRDCNYCGIRKSNNSVKRFFLDKENVIDAAKWCADQGYGSIVLQSGERQDSSFIDYIEEVVCQIKKITTSDTLPRGLGITLCVGQQTKEVYERFYAAGAHRYLLRIEASNKELFSSIHPPDQNFSERVDNLCMLKDVGFQVGTGVMIGLPGQTVEHLAEDILFFKEHDIDMIGMGPFIVHSKTPMSVYEEDNKKGSEAIFQQSLLMIAASRIVLGDVNIAATTALQALKDDGREQGLDFGANVIMPQLTPVEVRKDYLLYENKPCVDENKEQCRYCLERRILSLGREIGVNAWGDSQHHKNRLKNSVSADNA